MTGCTSKASDLHNAIYAQDVAVEVRSWPIGRIVQCGRWEGGGEACICTDHQGVEGRVGSLLFYSTCNSSASFVSPEFNTQESGVNTNCVRGSGDSMTEHRAMYMWLGQRNVATQVLYAQDEITPKRLNLATMVKSHVNPEASKYKNGPVYI